MIVKTHSKKCNESLYQVDIPLILCMQGKRFFMKVGDKNVRY